MIEGFAKFVHETHSDFHLVLHGYSSDHIRELATYIEQNHISGKIIVTGLLDIREQEALYKNASAWIDVGHYITSKTHLALALSHRLPLLLSDIKAFEHYDTALKIHPNNLINLPQYFIKLAEFPKPTPLPDFFVNIKATMEKYHVILTEKK